MRFAAFIVRFLAYSLVLWVAYAIAQAEWTNASLDLNDALTGLHSLGIAVLTVAPLVLAIVAIVARPVAIFVLFYLVGAVVTAPFALARFGG
ncbi:MAG TPA: hypothetical protein VGG22_08960 [Candidatus Baltobacteraceae bacterium]|jgi:hypothetical protein